MRLALRVLCVLLIGAGPVLAQPTLDDFYDRTRDRDEGFDHCFGYCDGTWLASLLVGAQTANPSTDTLRPEVASGVRLGVDIGVRGEDVNIARTKLWVDVLRVGSTGDVITDLAWQTTAFAATHGLHLSLDTLVARRTELEPQDIAELRRSGYTLLDVEGEAALVGGKIDKDGFLALPFGVANRLRWDDQTMALERRTSVSGALAVRGFPEHIRHHDQLDLLRLKYTDWDGRASAWTVSAGYQRLSPGIEELQIWLLGGYEWGVDDDHTGPVAQLGAQIQLATANGQIELGPMFDAHFELDPRTSMFERVFQGRFYVHHELGRVRTGLAYEVIVIPGQARLEAWTPELGVRLGHLELMARYRIAWLADQRMAVGANAPGDRFNVSADWLF